MAVLAVDLRTFGQNRSQSASIFSSSWNGQRNMFPEPHPMQAAILGIALIVAQPLFLTRSMAPVDLGENQDSVSEVISYYRDLCTRDPREDAVGGLHLPDKVTYEIVIDEFGKTATVLYTDFTCGNLGPIWCGTGGCDTYLFVDGKTFVWKVSYPPYTIVVTRQLTPAAKTLILFPLFGMYCKAASNEPTYGTTPCYELAWWDSEDQTFVTRNGLLTEIDPLGP